MALLYSIPEEKLPEESLGLNCLLKVTVNNDSFYATIIFDPKNTHVLFFAKDRRQQIRMRIFLNLCYTMKSKNHIKLFQRIFLF